MSAPAGWTVRSVRRAAAAIHGREIGAEGRRELWIAEPTDRSLVLGSAQRDDSFDRGVAEELGLEVVRRRSGGGAVLVEPGDLVWVDVFIPRDDPLWDDDIGRSFGWLGSLWCDVVAELSPALLEGDAVAVHDGPMGHNVASPHVCFAGRGPGEVLIGRRKVVGISQRRTRRGARFQCAVLRAWHPGALLDVFHRAAANEPAFALTVENCATGLDAPADAVVDTLLAQLHRR